MSDELFTRDLEDQLGRHYQTEAAAMPIDTRFWDRLSPFLAEAPGKGRGLRGFSAFPPGPETTGGEGVPASGRRSPGFRVLSRSVNIAGLAAFVLIVAIIGLGIPAVLPRLQSNQPGGMGGGGACDAGATPGPYLSKGQAIRKGIEIASRPRPEQEGLTDPRNARAERMTLAEAGRRAFPDSASYTDDPNTVVWLVTVDGASTEDADPFTGAPAPAWQRRDTIILDARTGQDIAISSGAPNGPEQLIAGNTAADAEPDCAKLVVKTSPIAVTIYRDGDATRLQSDSADLARHATATGRLLQELGPGIAPCDSCAKNRGEVVDDAVVSAVEVIYPEPGIQSRDGGSFTKAFIELSHTRYSTAVNVYLGNEKYTHVVSHEPSPALAQLQELVGPQSETALAQPTADAVTTPPYPTPTIVAEEVCPSPTAPPAAYPAWTPAPEEGAATPTPIAETLQASAPTAIPEGAPCSEPQADQQTVLKFIQAVAAGDDAQARSYLTPKYDSQVKSLQQELGITGPWENSAIHEWTKSEDRVATHTVTLEYPDHTLETRITVERRGSDWLITRIEPATETPEGPEPTPTPAPAPTDTPAVEDITAEPTALLEDSPSERIALAFVDAVTGIYKRQALSYLTPGYRAHVSDLEDAFGIPRPWQGQSPHWGHPEGEKNSNGSVNYTFILSYPSGTVEVEVRVEKIQREWKINHIEPLGATEGATPTPAPIPPEPTTDPMFGLESVTPTPAPEPTDTPSPVDEAPQPGTLAPEPTATPTDAPDMTGPGEPVVWRFLNAVAGDNEEQARTYLAPEYSSRIDDLDEALGIPPAWRDETPELHSVLGEAPPDGGGANYGAVLAYPDGGIDVGITLQEIGGHWKIMRIIGTPEYEPGGEQPVPTATPTPSQPTAPAAPEALHTISGELSVGGGPVYATDANGCSAALREEPHIVVMNENGQTLGAANFQTITVSGGNCVYSFTVPNIPESRQYLIMPLSVSNLTFTYSAEEMLRSGWRVHLHEPRK